MPEKEIEDYVKTQRSLGVGDSDIRKSLLNAGYTEADFREILAARHRQSVSAGEGKEITVSHLLVFQFLTILLFGGIIAYVSYDYNTKLDILAEIQEKNVNATKQELEAQSEGVKSLASQLSAEDSSIKNEISSVSGRISSVETSLDSKLQTYNYQSITRDSALSDSIQKATNKSLSDLQSFSRKLEQVKESNVDFTPIIPRATKAVVTIGRKGTGYFTTKGSGVFINSNGYLVTNYHVVDDLGVVDVKTYDQVDYRASIVGKDEVWDIAVLKISAEKKNFTYLEWGDSGKVVAGDHVIAIGNPVGFESTVTEGIISNTRRLIDGENSIYYLQSDVAINSGNSGGPLIDSDGKIIGIATLKVGSAGFEGLSFALRSNDVQTIVAKMLLNEKTAVSK
jgi:S1-C subfamily serine protease